MKDKEHWYTYIVECSDQTLYTGIARDVEKRIQEHNEGSGAKYTRPRLPVRLRYFEEQPDRSAASIREYEIKQMTRQAKLKMIKKFEV